MQRCINYDSNSNPISPAVRHGVSQAARSMLADFNIRFAFDEEEVAEGDDNSRGGSFNSCFIRSGFCFGPKTGALTKDPQGKARETLENGQVEFGVVEIRDDDVQELHGEAVNKDFSSVSGRR
eukprot:TRINITY_DN400_c1_g1_i5.p1 TRINITY_DN400_c1_g1~~TRINITY_DN400_c1_g1_i5.p1  ORF type:complete len:123 (+),score=32.30 TRINITY_DN400_c1_g1_i5:990-1358(+)